MKNQTLLSLGRKAPVTLFALIIVIITLLISFSQFSGPPPQLESIPIDEFSTDRAMGFLNNIAKEPHPMGSPANSEVRDYIINSFKELGIEVEVQKKDITEIKDVFYPDDNFKGNVENIIAKIPGEENPENAVIVTAHYDSTENGPGAADDGYGVSAILESARAIKNSPSPFNTVYFLLTDGEEPGMLGASAFIENKDILDQAKIIINLEARGNTGVPILFETNKNNKKLIQIFQDVAEYPVAYSFAYEVYKVLPNDTDFSVYKKIEKQGYNFANINGADTYHEMTDNLESVDKETLQHFGSYIYPLLKKFAFMEAEEFRQIENSNENAVYFPLFKKQLVVYPESYVVPMFIFLLVLTLLLSLIAFRINLIKIKNVLICTLLLLGSLIAVSILVFLCVRLYALIFNLQIYDFIYIFDAVHSDSVMVFLILLAVLFCFFGASWLMKKFGTSNVAIGSILFWVVLSGMTSLLVKGMSYAFVIPTILFIMSFILVLVVISFNGRLKAAYRYLMVTLWLMPSLLLLSPIIYLVYISMTIGMAPIIALLSSLIAFSGIISIKWAFNVNSDVVTWKMKTSEINRESIL